MKAKKIIVAILVLFCMVLTIPGLATAGYRLWECSVVAAGPDTTGDELTTGQIVLTLQRTGFDSKKTFVVKDGEENRVLAIALTALSSGMKVNVLIDWTHSDGDYIDGIWLINNP